MAESILTGLNGKSEIVVANHPLGSIEFIRSGSYCNLTQVAELNGKRIDNWLRLKSTKNLVAEFRKNVTYGGKPAIVTLTSSPPHRRMGIPRITS
jgi:hypothetical protein